MMIYTWPCVRASNEGLRSVYLPRLGTRLAKCLNSVLNVKAQIGNQEKVIAGAFSMNIKLQFLIFCEGSFPALLQTPHKECYRGQCLVSMLCVYPFQVKSNHNFCIFCVFS